MLCENIELCNVMKCEVLPHAVLRLEGAEGSGPGIVGGLLSPARNTYKILKGTCSSAWSSAISSLTVICMGWSWSWQ